MKIRKKKALPIFLLLSLLWMTTSYAMALNCPEATCAPCGYVSGNVTDLPSDAPRVNPLMNYVATCERVRCHGYFSGPYIGLAYGGGAISYQLKVEGVRPFGLQRDIRSYLVTLADAGFNFVFRNFLLGAEVGYHYRSRVNSISYFDVVDSISTLPPPLVIVRPGQVRFDINSQHAGTADILPGFVYSRFAGYLRLGVEETKYDWTRRFCFPLLTLNNAVAPSFVTINEKDFVETIRKKATALRLGAGLAIAANTHVSFHLNYIHTFTPRLTLTPDVLALAASSPITIPVTVPIISLEELAANDRITPQRDEVNFGVKFRF
jgi:opacity protein-like surface antigen